MKPSQKVEMGGEHMCGGTQPPSFSTTQKTLKILLNILLGYQSSYKYPEESNFPPKFDT